MASPRGANWGELKKRLSKKCDFRSKNIKKTESPKMTSKVLYELLIKSYERFKYFSRTLNLSIFKSTSLNQRNCEHHEKINFSHEKIQKMWHPMVTNDLSSRRKLRKNFKKKIVDNPVLRLKNIKKTESPKMTSKVFYELLTRSYERFKYFFYDLAELSILYASFSHSYRS